MTQERDTITLNGKAILHSTARRDWVCGTCGGALATRWFDEDPTWRTICTGDASHDPDRFVHQSTWAYLKHRRLKEAGEAQVVFDNLPDELQAAIVAAQ